MKTLDHNAIARSVDAMGFRLGAAMYRKRHATDAFRATEIQQQYQVEIGGVAGAGAFTESTIHFQETMYYAPLQRNITTEDPQVTWGVNLDKGDAFVSVHVKRWLLDDNANYIGAVLRIGVMQGAYAGQGGVEGSAFKGTIHVTFQGYGIPVEDPGFDETP